MRSESIDDLASTHFVHQLVSAELLLFRDGLYRVVVGQAASEVDSCNHHVVVGVRLRRMCKLRVYCDILHSTSMCLPREHIVDTLEFVRAGSSDPVVDVRNPAFGCTEECIWRERTRFFHRVSEVAYRYRCLFHVRALASIITYTHSFVGVRSIRWLRLSILEELFGPGADFRG